MFTMGTKDYAVAVTRILDPERKLFSDRVISRDESSFKSLEATVSESPDIIAVLIAVCIQFSVSLWR